MSSATTSSAPAFTRSGPGWRYRVESMPVRRLQDFCIGALVVAAVGAVHAVNMTAAPGRTTDEGALVARAWLLGDSGFLGRSTDWYDHPPLGWLLVGAWTSLTSAFDRAPTAVGAGRELMLVAYVAGAGLLWVLGRRLGLDRWATAVALAVFGLAPIAVDLHRQVLLDNLAVPLVLAAFALAGNPRRPLVAYAASGACLAAAVLTKETSLVFVPLLAWQHARSSLPSTRRYGLVVGGTLFVLVCAAYLVPVAVAGELTAGDGHAGLLDGVGYRLTHLGGTELLTSAVIALLPFAGLAVGALVQTAWHRRESTGRSPAPLLAVGSLAAVAVVSWWVVEHRLVVPDSDAEPLQQAETWAVTNLRDTPVRLVADDAVWVDLVEAGLSPQQVAAATAFDLPDDVGPPAPGPWSDYDVVLSTGTVRDIPEAAAALRGSVVLATFGTGADRVEIRRIGAPAGESGGADVVAQGEGLARNPSVLLTDEARAALVAGEVDSRVMTVLVALATDDPLEVVGFPADPAEIDAGVPRRVVELRFGSRDEARAAATVLEAQQAPYRPADIEIDPDGQVTVTYVPAPLT